MHDTTEILNQLSSRKGDKTAESNKAAAGKCIENPLLLDEITKGLTDKDKKLQTDCIEVLTLVSENHPGLVAPYTNLIVPLLTNKETKIRWEAVHTLSYIADKIPDTISSVIPLLRELISSDKSTIVRDYALDTVANYAKTGKEAAEQAFGILNATLTLWGEKHAKQVFKGFGNILKITPSHGSEIEKIVQPYTSAAKKVVATEAQKIIKTIQK